MNMKEQFRLQIPETKTAQKGADVVDIEIAAITPIQINEGATSQEMSGKASIGDEAILPIDGFMKETIEKLSKNIHRLEAEVKRLEATLAETIEGKDEIIAGLNKEITRQKTLIETLKKHDQEFSDIIVEKDQQIEEQKIIIENLANKVDTDILIENLPNLRSFEKNIAFEISRAERSEEPLSVLFLDIDNFGILNVDYGHEIGNIILQEFARKIDGKRDDSGERTEKGLLQRKVDGLYRYGGEEFVVILPNTDKKGALVVAEKIRRAFANERLVVTPEGQEIKITVSIGAKELEVKDAKSEGRKSFIDGADKAMLVAKGMGRNQTHIFNERTLREYDRLKAEGKIKVEKAA